MAVIPHHCVLAVSINGFHSDVIQPFALRAPEVILGCGWDTSIDIWNLGCLARYLLLLSFPFLSLTEPCLCRSLNSSLATGFLCREEVLHGQQRHTILRTCPLWLRKSLMPLVFRLESI